MLYIGNTWLHGFKLLFNLAMIFFIMRSMLIPIYKNCSKMFLLKEACEVLVQIVVPQKYCLVFILTIRALPSQRRIVEVFFR